MPHPSEEQLLRYSDGELPGRNAGQVQSHLKACWQCRTNLDEMEEAVAASVRYRTSVLQRHLPAPPAPWADIYRSFAEIDAATPAPSFADRLLGALAWPVHHPRKWVPVAVAAMLLAGLFYRYRVTPSVQAAALLRKAILASDTHAVKPHLLRIRTKGNSVTRRTGSSQALAASASEKETLNSLQTLFTSAKYNWDDPLSARSFSAWRNQLPSKQDQVTETSGSYRIRTETESGDLLEADLQLSAADLQPIEGRFSFRNADWVEITALPDQAEPVAAATIPSLPEIHATLPAEPKPSTEITPSSLTPAAGDELRVLTALHQLGADLGDPVELSRTEHEIIVSGVGIPPARRQEIETALNGLPNVVVRFANAPAATVPARTVIADAQPNGPLQSQIAEQVGGRAHFDELAAQVLDRSEQLMARVYALRRIEERFPAAVVAQLSPEDLGTLRRLQREHTAALRQQVVELEQLLQPVGHASGLSEARQGLDPPLFQSARRVEKLLAVVFGAAPPDDAANTSQLPAQLMSAVTELRANVEAYDHLLAKTER
ncbi:MAG TPA: hypothetical protein VKT81_07580 [Bryobacteraceae bacterium]|nr:hypothetical protein [Bryobacteraceae bacterium]